MRLYLNETSPFARFVLVTALETDIADLELHWVDPWGSPGELTALNPFSMVPTLEVEDGLALYESVFICDYLIARAGSASPLRAATPGDLVALRRYALGKSLMEVAFRKVVLERFLDKQPDNVLAERATLALNRLLPELETMLAGERRSSAAPIALPDLCLAVALEYVRFRLPALFDAHLRLEASAWLERYRSQASFALSAPECLKNQPVSLTALRQGGG